MTWYESCSIAGLGPLNLPKVRCDRSQRPWWEAARLHCMHHYLGPGDRILDVGTEMGDMSALFASWGCDMYLVEPNPKAWPWIASTFDANQLDRRVRGWFMGLLGATPQARESKLDPLVFMGELDWPESADDPMDEATGFFHLNEHTPVSPVVTIDWLVSVTGFEPTAITMDIEGGEMDALLGAATTIQGLRPRVWVSVHPEFLKNYRHTAGQVHDLMRSYDYDPVFLATDHEEHWMYLPKEHGWSY